MPFDDIYVNRSVSTIYSAIYKSWLFNSRRHPKKMPLFLLLNNQFGDLLFNVCVNRI
jgi:hypothetical protein